MFLFRMFSIVYIGVVCILAKTPEVIRMKNTEVFQKDVIKGFDKGFVIQSVG